MQIEGISHLTFAVKDLALATKFFLEGLGAQEVWDSKTRPSALFKEKFFTLGTAWIAVIEGEKPIERTYRHTAFKVSEADLPQFEARLRAIGVDIKPPRPRVAGEGLSLYFYDFDNHLFELHTGTLEQRLQKFAEERSR